MSRMRVTRLRGKHHHHRTGQSWRSCYLPAPPMQNPWLVLAMPIIAYSGWVPCDPGNLICRKLGSDGNRVSRPVFFRRIWLGLAITGMRRQWPSVDLQPQHLHLPHSRTINYSHNFSRHRTIQPRQPPTMGNSVPRKQAPAEDVRGFPRIVGSSTFLRERLLRGFSVAFDHGAMSEAFSSRGPVDFWSGSPRGCFSMVAVGGRQCTDRNAHRPVRYPRIQENRREYHLHNISIFCQFECKIFCFDLQCLACFALHLGGASSAPFLPKRRGQRTFVLRRRCHFRALSYDAMQHRTNRLPEHPSDQQEGCPSRPATKRFGCSGFSFPPSVKYQEMQSVLPQRRTGRKPWLGRGRKLAVPDSPGLTGTASWSFDTPCGV